MKRLLSLIFCAGFLVGCADSTPVNNQTANVSAAKPTPARSPQTSLEDRLFYIKNGNFRQVVAISRKDNGKLTSEDIDYIKQYAPSEQINQRLLTDDNKYVVAGTNFKFTPEQMEALQKRFTVEDFTAEYGRLPEAPKTETAASPAAPESEKK